MAGTGTWLLHHRQTEQQAAVALRRHGMLRGAAAEVELVVRPHPQGGCQVHATGHVPKMVWLSTLSLFVALWTSGIWRDGWSDWIRTEAGILVVCYLVFCGFWRHNLMSLVRDLQEAVRLGETAG